MKGTEPCVSAVVKDEVATSVPNCPLPPSTKEPWRPIDEAIPPANVDVAVEVLVIEPVVSVPVVMLEKMEETERKMFTKKVVEVAFVPVAFIKVKFWRVLEPLTNKAPVVVTLVTFKFPEISALPCNENSALGEVVPKPTLPPAVITE